jgi:hypothetical protein
MTQDQISTLRLNGAQSSNYQEHLSCDETTDMHKPLNCVINHITR